MVSESDRAEIRRLRLKGLTCTEVAAALGGRVSRSAVGRIAPGRGQKGVRCRTCGARVVPPCRLCAQRGLTPSPEPRAPHPSTLTPATESLPLVQPTGGGATELAARTQPGRKEAA